MTTKASRRGFPVFWTLLLLFVAASLAAMAWGLAKLRPILAAYEESQPKYYAEDIFNAHFLDPDFAALVAQAGIPDNVSPLENAESFAAELEERHGDKPMTYASTTAGSDGSLRYLVKAGDEKIGIFSMREVKGDPDDILDFSSWELSDVELYIRPEESIKITVQTGSEVYVNGRLLDDSYLTETGIKTDTCDHMPKNREGVEGITFCTYEASALLRAPEIAVKTPQGKDAPLTLDEETGAWTAEIVYDDALAAAQSAQIIKVAQNYAAFVMRDAYFASFSGYFDKTTDLYQTIREVPTSFVWAHNGFEFRDVSATEFYAYADDVFSCRVRFVHVLHRNNSEDYTEQFDVTFYLHRVDGEFLIYDMVNN